MVLFSVLLLMTALAIMAVLWPLSRQGQGLRAGSDVAVYRDQLAEIGRDRKAGHIGEQEAEAARIEVSRRLLAAAEAAPVPAASSASARRIVALAALVLLPAGATSLYLVLGAPSVPAAPLAARIDTPLEGKPVAAMVAQVEAHLARNPGDGRGWEVLAPIYLRAGRHDEAVKAGAEALRLLGPDAAREALLGEALTYQANGVVTRDAKSAFERAAALDGANPSAQYFLGLAAEQDGRMEDAGRIWRALLARAQPDSEWRGLVADALKRIEGAPAPEKR